MSSTAAFKEWTFDTGVLAAGWKLYHYEPGTTNEKTAWLDRNKNSTAPNPIVADALGAASGYFDGLYDIVVKDADGVTKYTWEDVFLSDLQALGTEGSSLTSATTLVLGATTEVYYHVTGSASIEGLSGDQAFVILTFDSTPGLIHGSNFQLELGQSRFAIANETVLFVNDGGGKWREVGIWDRVETTSWTPTLTFSTPGNLNVAYTNRSGMYTRHGRIGILSFSILTSTFTHTTASGTMWITGLPVSVLPEDAIIQFPGSLSFRGITKANYTQYTPYVADGVSNIQIMCSGSGQTPADLAFGDMPTGGTVQLYGTIVFLCEPTL